MGGPAGRLAGSVFAPHRSTTVVELIGASRPEQVLDNVKASGVRLEADLKKRMDEILAPVVEIDPALTQSPNPRA